ncbi:MAG: hypothetical protein E7616_07035 [Ruminococcaceae bacterium]|nr:hypothetical protein [Oscillospiraceae bacterium]
MKKFFCSKFFVPISTAVTFVISLASGILLGFECHVRGTMSSGFGGVYTDYVFQFREALGYWLLGLVFTYVVYLLCILVRAQFLKDAKKNDDSSDT